MKFRVLIKGRALFQEENKIWIAQGMKFFAVDYLGNRLTQNYYVGNFWERIIGVFRLSRQALRNGIHHLLPLRNGNLLVCVKRKVYILSKNGNILNVFSNYQGNKPAHQGICVTPDGTIFFGEYLLNTKRESNVAIYRSLDGGNSFHAVKIFPAGDIRHVHFIKWDNYEKCLWMGTGDYGENNKECRLYKSSDNGNTWDLIGQGSQDWRAIGVCFDNESLLWGTDAGSTSDVNHLIMMNRKTQQLEVLEEFEGPCHGCASYKDGRMFFSTGVEGGENEKDRFSRLKEFQNNHTTEILKLKKDIWPLIVQYGVMRFPLGTDNVNRVVFTTMGLKNYGEKVLIEE